MRFGRFDKGRLRLKSLLERKHELNLEAIAPLPTGELLAPIAELTKVAESIVRAKDKAAVILLAGGHVFRSGVQRYLIDLMERGYISCLATNGAGLIHDFEFSLIGATTESVARYISEGQFGLWRETGRINDVINAAYKKDRTIGLGEAVGRYIQQEKFPHQAISLFAAGYRLGIPITVHVGIGYDIIHEHPNCDGAATGALSYNDFLKFAAVVEQLENGVAMNFGSAVMAPEVFLKALSMARNVARQKNSSLSRFTTLVCDLQALPVKYDQEPARNDQGYYFRPWKTMLIRTTADGGRSYYVRGQHAETIPRLWAAIKAAEKALEK